MQVYFSPISDTLPSPIMSVLDANVWTDHWPSPHPPIPPPALAHILCGRSIPELWYGSRAEEVFKMWLVPSFPFPLSRRSMRGKHTHKSSTVTVHLINQGFRGEGGSSKSLTRATTLKPLQVSTLWRGEEEEDEKDETFVGSIWPKDEEQIVIEVNGNYAIRCLIRSKQKHYWTDQPNVKRCIAHVEHHNLFDFAFWGGSLTRRISSTAQKFWGDDWGALAFR